MAFDVDGNIILGNTDLTTQLGNTLKASDPPGGCGSLTNSEECIEWFQTANLGCGWDCYANICRDEHSTWPPPDGPWYGYNYCQIGFCEDLSNYRFSFQKAQQNNWEPFQEFPGNNTSIYPGDAYTVSYKKVEPYNEFPSMDGDGFHLRCQIHFCNQESGCRYISPLPGGGSVCREYAYLEPVFVLVNRAGKGCWKYSTWPDQICYLWATMDNAWPSGDFKQALIDQILVDKNAPPECDMAVTQCDIPSNTQKDIMINGFVTARVTGSGDCTGICAGLRYDDGPTDSIIVRFIFPDGNYMDLDMPKGETLFHVIWGDSPPGTEQSKNIPQRYYQEGTYHISCIAGTYTEGEPIDVYDEVSHTVYVGGCEQYTDKSECIANGCHWYNNACHTDEPSCHLLDNQSDCLAYGCYWYNNGCHSNPPPDCEDYTNQTDCLNAGCYWYDNSCHTNPPPPPDCEDYVTKSECIANGCHWYNNACHTYVPTCEQLNNQSDCLDYGCYWYNGSCHGTPPPCENYTNQTECLNAGCHWYNGSCHTYAPTCEQLNNQSDCLDYGCYWYNNGCHTSPPPCESITNQAECINAGCYWYNNSCHSSPSVPPIPPPDDNGNGGGITPNMIALVAILLAFPVTAGIGTLLSGKGFNRD